MKAEFSFTRMLLISPQFPQQMRFWNCIMLPNIFISSWYTLEIWPLFCLPNWTHQKFNCLRTNYEGWQYKIYHENNQILHTIFEKFLTTHHCIRWNLLFVSTIFNFFTLYEKCNGMDWKFTYIFLTKPQGVFLLKSWLCFN